MTQEDIGYIQKLFTKVKEISALWIPNKESFGNSTYSENSGFKGYKICNFQVMNIRISKKKGNRYITKHSAENLRIYG